VQYLFPFSVNVKECKAFSWEDKSINSKDVVNPSIQNNRIKGRPSLRMVLLDRP
jgi:hypothetical protein